MSNPICVEEVNESMFPYLRFLLKKDKTDLEISNKMSVKVKISNVEKLIPILMKKQSIKVNLTGFQYFILNWSEKNQLWHVNFKKTSLSQYGILYFEDILNFSLEQEKK